MHVSFQHPFLVGVAWLHYLDEIGSSRKKPYCRKSYHVRPPKRKGDDATSLFLIDRQPPSWCQDRGRG